MVTYQVGQRGVACEQSGVIVEVMAATEGGAAYRFKADSGAEYTVMAKEFTAE